MTAQKKAAGLGAGEAAQNSKLETKHNPAQRFLKALHASIRHARWLLSYSIEDAKQRHALRRTGGAR